MKNIKYTVTHPIFVFMKKHFCPHCKAALTVETAHHLVNSRSEEAKDYDFSTEDGRMIGTVDFRNPYFPARTAMRSFLWKNCGKWRREKGQADNAGKLKNAPGGMASGGIFIL